MLAVIFDRPFFKYIVHWPCACVGVITCQQVHFLHCVLKHNFSVKCSVGSSDHQVVNKISAFYGIQRLIIMVTTLLQDPVLSQLKLFHPLTPHLLKGHFIILLCMHGLQSFQLSSCNINAITPLAYSKSRSKFSLIMMLP